jgi:hypothetical protein
MVAATLGALLPKTRQPPVLRGFLWFGRAPLIGRARPSSRMGIQGGGARALQRLTRRLLGAHLSASGSALLRLAFPRSPPLEQAA